MSKNIKLRKGLDINLKGKAEAVLEVAPMAKSYAVSPLDYECVTPKLLVKVGDKVEAGQALFFDKNNPRILFTSPVSGVVSAINRGEKRKLLNVAVEPDQEQVAQQTMHRLQCFVMYYALFRNVTQSGCSETNE